MMNRKCSRPGRQTVFGLLMELGLLIPATSQAQDGDPPPLVEPRRLGASEDPKLDTKAQQVAPTAFASKEPKPVAAWGVGRGKSYGVPAFDIVGEEFLLNQFDRHFVDGQVYGSSFGSAKRNLQRSWPVDTDPFSINQFDHPYQGNIYFGFARSAGQDFWTSMGYAFMGSALWEIAGETGPGSINDQYTTTLGGSFLGEPLFRMASLALESGDHPPGFWREVGAAFISPATGFNRYAYGHRFDGVFRSNDPAVYTRLQLGVNFNATVHSNVNTNPNAGQPPVPQEYQRGEANADFTMDYGLPGKPGYTYDRPFDYFHFQARATSSNVFETILADGLLYGRDYEAGDRYRGVWGLYGTYDYIAPQIFRISTTGAGLGTTGQWWISRQVAWQGTALASVGYGSAGTIEGVDQRDYHNGITPAALLASRLIFGDRAALELNLRDYHVSGLYSGETRGAENIERGDVSLTVRIFNLHGITLRYAATRRDAHYPDINSTHQSVGAVSIGYTYLGHARLGAVDWRPKSEGGPE